MLAAWVIWEFTKEARSQSKCPWQESKFPEKANHTFTGFFVFNLFALASEKESFGENFPGSDREEEGEGERQAGGNETGVLDKQQGWSVSSRLRMKLGGQGRWSARERHASFLTRRGAREVLLRKLGELLKVMSETEHLPSKDFANWQRAWFREPILSVRKKGRKQAGNIQLSGKSHLWMTRRGQQGQNRASWSPLQGRHPHFTFTWCFTLYKTQPPSHWSSWSARRAQYHFFSRWRNYHPEISDTLDYKLSNVPSTTPKQLLLGKVCAEWVELEGLCK